MMTRALFAGLVLAAVPAAAQVSPPDYAQEANWSPAASALPAGTRNVAQAPKVDVFYLHPTTMRGEGQMNADPVDAKSNLWVDESVVARQASAFTGCCRVFAPRYRAATYNSFVDPAKREQAFALAYSDVERAFDQFLQHHSKGRPFIIAGHSQGAFHAATLLEKRIDRTPLQRRLVAAYIVGINLSEGDFGRRFKQVRPCTTPRETSCVLQWEAILAGSDVTTAAARSQSTFVAKYGDVDGKQTLCINPLTFDARKPRTSAKAAKGAVPGDPGFGTMRPLLAGKVAARCEQGMLVVEPDAALELKPLPGGSMHYHDFGLFWADVRADAKRRAAAFRR
jgi:pimeloyl-ACP methyl ester carboxylesterase